MYISKHTVESLWEQPGEITIVTKLDRMNFFTSPMTGLQWPVTIIWYVANIINLIVCSSIALVSVGWMAVQAFLSLRKLPSSAKVSKTDVSCQTESADSSLVRYSLSVQTDSVADKSSNVATQSSAIHVTSVETQTNDIECEKGSLGLRLPPTPSTVESSYDLNASMTPTASPASGRADPLRIPSLARSGSAVTTKDEELAFDSDMDSFLKCAMSHVLTSDSKRGSSLFHDSDMLYAGIGEGKDWFSQTIERYTTVDSSNGNSTVLGGGVYRTVSDPTSEAFPMEEQCDNMVSDLESTLEYKIRPRNQLDIVSQIQRMTKVLSGAMDGLVRESGIGATEKIALVPFGALACNLLTSLSSIDLMLMVPPVMFESLFPAATVSSPINRSEIPINQIKDHETRLMMRKALSWVSEVLNAECGLTLVKLSNVGSISAVTSAARVPTLTMVDLATSTRFEFTCNNLFPLFSTRLVKSYVDKSSELRDFILLVKYWARKRGLTANAANGNRLSGFTWTLLCLFYCQAGVGVLPSLQALSTERRQWKDPFGSRRCDVSFVESLPEINWDGLDAVSMFAGFIDFWANYWNWSSGVVSIRLGRVVGIDAPEILIKQISPQAANMQTASSCKIHVEDPFDTKRDLGMCLTGLACDDLKKEFMSTSWTLSGNSLQTEGLFEILNGGTTEDENVALYNLPTRRTVTLPTSKRPAPFRRSGSCM